MSHPLRPVAFVLASTNHGTLIVNRNDQHLPDGKRGYGVGYQLLTQSAFDPQEVGLVLRLLDLRRQHFGNGVFAIDGGANVGVHTVEWARHLHGWGQVLAFEAQEVVFYALAGNLAINNCLNARARWCALGQAPGQMLIPQPDYLAGGSFGSLELRQRERTEFIGQAVSYAPADCAPVNVVSIDSLQLPRLDLLKLDIEGMEIEVLRGAAQSLARLRPVLLVETLKSGAGPVQELLHPLGYRSWQAGINLIAVHQDDPVNRHIELKGRELRIG